MSVVSCQSEGPVASVSTRAAFGAKYWQQVAMALVKAFAEGGIGLKKIVQVWVFAVLLGRKPCRVNRPDGLIGNRPLTPLTGN